MLIQIGVSTLLFSFFSALFGIIALLLGLRTRSEHWIQSGRRACLILFPLLTIAVGVLILAILQRNYHLDYVYQTIDNSMPLYLQITAIWGKQSGSLLFWSWLFSLFIFIWTQTETEKELFPSAAIFLLANISFFLILNFWVENPFQRLWADINTGLVYKNIRPVAGTIAYFAENGQGMNPLLRHFGMVFHPPALYLGYLGIFIPAARQISAAIHHPGKTDWVKQNRRWELFAWLFLAIGLILGSRWAYDVLGWGGYWGWDPVEVSALIPFLLLTAYLHAAAGFSRTGKYQIWLNVCITLTVFSIVFSTFVTRSGLIASVHAFSISPISNYLLIYTLLFLVFLLVILVRSLRNIRSDGSKHALEVGLFLQTRDFVFYSMLILLSLIAFFCLWGILLPAISQWLSPVPIAVDKKFYTVSTGPLFLLFLLFTGIYPLTRWGKPFTRSSKITGLFSSFAAIGVTVYLSTQLVVTTPLRFLTIAVISFSLLVYLADLFRPAFIQAETGTRFEPIRLLKQFRAPHRVFLFMLHFGVLLMSIGIVGIEFFQQETQLSLKINEPKEFAGYQITLTDFTHAPSADGMTTRSSLRLEWGDNRVEQVFPMRKFYSVYQQETTLPGIHSQLEEDLYIILMSSSINQTNETHQFTIFLNPMINWLWIGAVITCLGCLYALLCPKKVPHG